MIAGLCSCRLPFNLDLQGQTIASIQFGRSGDSVMGPAVVVVLGQGCEGRGHWSCPQAPFACTKFAAERVSPLLIHMDLLCSGELCTQHTNVPCSLLTVVMIGGEGQTENSVKDAWASEEPNWTNISFPLVVSPDLQVHYGSDWCLWTWIFS